jgi:hypothetical protein
LYRDSAKLFSASLLIKNMGTQLKKYDGTEADDIPFDLQLGITQKLAQAPFGISVTAVKLHQFNIRYDDTTFNNENGFTNAADQKVTAGKIVDHLVLALTADVGDHVELMAGYNFLRRRELSVGNAANGLNGFSLGTSVQLGKFSVTYARAYYQNNTANNQFGLNLTLNQYTGLGKFGERIGW